MPTISQFTRASEIGNGISGGSDERTVQYLAKLNEPVADPFSDDGDVLVLDYAENNTPITWDNMPRTGISLEQITPTRFRVTVNYSRKDPEKSGRESREGATTDVKYSFKIGTENTRKFYALNQQKFGAKAVNHGTFVNVVTEETRLKVEGVDVPVPVQEFDIAVTQPYTTLTTTYMRTVEDLTGKLNNATFRGRAAGEVLFKGADGSISSRGDSEITYHFAVKKNPSLPMTVGGITIPSGTSVYGWDYIWVQWNTTDDPTLNDLQAGATGVYVARVLETGDFGLLGLGV